MRAFAPRYRLLAGLAALSLSTHAFADIIFNNLGPGDTFSAGGRIIQGESVGTIGDVDQASSFTVGASDVAVTSVTLGIGVSSSPSVGTGPLDILIAADTGSGPGAVLRTLHVVATLTGQQTITGTDDGSLVLSANTMYWVIADGKTTFDGAWDFNAIGDVGFTAGRSNGGAWNLRTDDTRYALRVEGRVVPEPASMLLLGLAGLLIRRR